MNVLNENGFIRLKEARLLHESPETKSFITITFQNSKPRSIYMSLAAFTILGSPRNYR